MRARRVTGWTLALLMWTVLAPAQTSAPLDGVWRLESYRGGGSEGAASGQLIFERGHFTYLYTMNEDRPVPDGRAHAGTYRVEGTDTLVFALHWDLQYVKGAATVNRKPVENRSRMVLDGDTLTITFANGAVQVLKRVR